VALTYAAVWVIALAAWQARRWGVGAHMQRIVDQLVSPQAGHGDNAVCNLADGDLFSSRVTRFTGSVASERRVDTVTAGGAL
jgi:hypothetical protein